MAALGKIRSKGVVLISILGIALFAFIAEEGFRSCDASRAESSQQVGEVLGHKVNVQDFQKLIDEYTNVVKITQGRDNLTDDELNYIKDVVWQTYVQNELIGDEASKLGLKVTDKEMQNILVKGTNPMLMNTPFVNRQTGRFDVNLLKKFVAEYNQAKTTNPQLADQYQSLYDFWMFVEKSLRQQLLAEKYHNLLRGCMISNPVSAKFAYDNENQESDVQLASLAYTSINDNKVKVEDSDLKAKYEKLKSRFMQYEETRSIKYIAYQVVPSQADRTALNQTVDGYVKALNEVSDPTETVRKSASLVPYLGIPQTKAAFPMDIAARLDSISVGSVSAPVENKQDNTINVIKLISKTQLPDSVQYRTIQVAGATPDEIAKRADSIYTALNNGADFEVVAKKYGQTGEKTWLTSAQYQNAPSMDADTKTYLNSLNTMAVNSIKNIKFTQWNMVVQVTDRKGLTDKYVAAVIKKPIEFSKNTYSAAYNKFSQFVSESQTPEALQKNAAKYGYKVMENPDVRNSEHYVAGIRGTRDAMKWIFDAKENTISPLYECGNNDRLLVLVMNKINKKGYRTLEDEDVKNYVKQEVLRDKKAEMLIAKLNGVKNIDGAKSKGAQIATVNQVTFAAPVFVQSTGMSEPALSGAVSATAKGKFCATPVKGYAGVYMFQVNDRRMRPVKFVEKDYEKRLAQKYIQYAGSYMQELLLNADLVDKRYLFF